jgi:hypothetical protein
MGDAKLTRLPANLSGDGHTELKEYPTIKPSFYFQREISGVALSQRQVLAMTPPATLTSVLSLPVSSYSSTMTMTTLKGCLKLTRTSQEYSLSLYRERVELLCLILVT